MPLPHHVAVGLRQSPSNKITPFLHLASGSQTLVPDQTGSVCDNVGASGVVTYNLPAAPKLGLEYTFVVAVAQELRVNPGDSHSMIVSGATGTAGNYFGADDEGETLIARWNGTAWLCTVTGTWTQES